MTPELYSQIKRYVQKVLYAFAHEFVEDCTQYVAMKLLEKPNRGWRYTIYDWCRENGYSNSSRVKSGARPLAFGNLLLETSHDLDDNESVDYLDDRMVSHELDRLLSLVHGPTRRVLSMRRRGLSMMEIGKHFHCTESRASQLYAEAISEVQRRMNRPPRVHFKRV